MNFAAALDALHVGRPDDVDRIAVRGDDRALSRRAFRDATVAGAALLRDRWNVRFGDRVGYLGLNRVEELVLFFALARIGAVFVPLNTRLAAVELTRIAAHAQLRVLVVDDVHREVGRIVAEAAGVPSDTVALRSIDELPGDADAPMASPTGDHVVAVDPATPLLLVYTSGTTGAPKGAVHTHGGVAANAAAAVDAHDLGDADVVLAVLPLFHVGGLCIQTLPALLGGAVVVLHARFHAASWLAAFATHRPTLALMVPATLRAVMAEPAWASTDLSSLRVLMAGSSIVPRHLIDRVHARDVPLGQVYGSTETGPVTVVLRAADARRKAGRAGWPCFPDSVRLVDAEGRDVAAHSTGEIVVRAPNVMAGYWREPASTGFRDGWFATGDLGRFDGDGCLEVVGRSRELIISGGENVYPAEVEDVLLTIPGVAEAAVIGIDDATWGEIPIAFVVAVRGASLDAAGVLAVFENRLARYKHPKRVIFVDGLPRNVMGKVQAHLLRERIAGRKADA